MPAVHGEVPILRRLVLPCLTVSSLVIPSAASRTASGNEIDEGRGRGRDCVGGRAELLGSAAKVDDEAAAVPGSSAPVSVRVPPGRLYLDPSNASVLVPSATRVAALPDVLVADLREHPGWQLELTVRRISVVGGGATPPHALRLEPLEPRLIAGGPGGARAARPAMIGAGDCVVIATAAAATGRASYFQSATIEVPRRARVNHDVVVDVELRLVSRARR